jgi:hypothetical protein
MMSYKTDLRSPFIKELNGFLAFFSVLSNVNKFLKVLDVLVNIRPFYFKVIDFSIGSGGFLSILKLLFKLIYEYFKGKEYIIYCRIYTVQLVFYVVLLFFNLQSLDVV